LFLGHELASFPDTNSNFIEISVEEARSQHESMVLDLPGGESLAAHRHSNSVNIGDAVPPPPLVKNSRVPVTSSP
jgi:hypothetical protein